MCPSDVRSDLVSTNSQMSSREQTRTEKGVTYPIQSSSFMGAGSEGVVYPSDANSDSNSTSGPVTRKEYNEQIVRTVPTLDPMVRTDMKPFLPHDGPMRAEDLEDDNVYYCPSETIEDLLRLIQDMNNFQCVEVLRYLGWDAIRLRQRDKLWYSEKLSKAPTGKTFLPELVEYHNDIDHPVCKLIDQAVFLVTEKRSHVYIHLNPMPVTGKAVAAEQSLDPVRVGPVEYQNPLHLLKNLTCDQLTFIAQQLLPNKTKRKVKNISNLSKLWKQAVLNGEEDVKKKMYQVIDQSFKSMHILMPLSMHFRAVSTQVLYQTKNSTTISNHLLFNILLASCGPGTHYYIVCGAIPERLSKEEIEKQLQSEPMVYLSHVGTTEDSYTIPRQLQSNY